MRSPFRVFRKYQKESIVILIGMAMFAFVFLDAIAGLGQVPPSLWIVLLAMVFGGVFWVVGTKASQGSQKEYSLAGAILGAAVGFLLMALNREAPAVQTSAGDISQGELQQMMNERQIAVQFMSQAYQRAVPQPALSPRLTQRLSLARQLQQFRQMPLQQAMQMAMMRASPEERREWRQFQQWQQAQNLATFRLIQFNDRPNGIERDVVFKYLLLQEAEKLGIQVSDEAVLAFIKRMTNEQLSPSTFIRIRENIRVGKTRGVSEAELIDILRKEIAAQLVYRLKVPEMVHLPAMADYWERFTKLNVRQRLEFTEVPVKPFLEEVTAEPTEQQLRELFEKYKDRLPTGQPTAEPAFMLPQRAQIAYFEADYESIEQDVIRRLEADVLSGDERQAELQKIKDAVAEFERKLAAGEIPPEDRVKEYWKAKQPSLRRLLTSKDPVNRLEWEIVKRYEDNKDPQYVNEDYTARVEARKKQKEAERRDPTKSGPVQAPRPKPAPEKPAPEKPGRDKPAPKTDEPKTGKKKTTGSPKPRSKNTESPQKTSPVPKSPDDSGAALRAPRSSAVSAIAPPTAGRALFSVAPQPFPKTKDDASQRPGNNAGAVAAPPPPLPYFPEQPAAPKPVSARRPLLPFEPLDAELRSTLRDDVLREHTQTEIEQRMQKAAAAMQTYSRQYIRSLESPDGQSEDAFDPEQVSNELQKLGKSLDLKYVVTELFSQLEFRNESKYPMGSAIEMGPKFARPRNRRVAEVLFPPRPRDDRNADEQRTRALELYQVIRAQTFGGGDGSGRQTFVLWKTIHRPARVPQFDETQTREKVLEAWQEIQARQLARKRAEQLADRLRQAKKPMQAAFRGESVTGEPDGDPLRSDLFPPRNSREGGFTWQTIQSQRSKVPSTGIIPPGAQLVSTEIPGIENPGEEFRKYIFEELDDGEIGVAPNVDKTRYYVVRVLDRYPVTPEGRREFIQQFLRQQPFGASLATPYDELNSAGSPRNQQLRRQIERQLFEQYNVRMSTQTSG